MSVPARSQHTDKMSPDEEKLEAWKTCQYQRDHNTPIRCHPSRTETQEDQEKNNPSRRARRALETPHLLQPRSMRGTNLYWNTGIQ